jgi:hypothetical protein
MESMVGARVAGRSSPVRSVATAVRRHRVGFSGGGRDESKAIDRIAGGPD